MVSMEAQMLAFQINSEDLFVQITHKAVNLLVGAGEYDMAD